MSINSLLSNVKILDELQNIINEQQPPSTEGILTLVNTDGNVDVSVVGNVGNVNLSHDINLTKASLSILGNDPNSSLFLTNDNLGVNIQVIGGINPKIQLSEEGAIFGYGLDNSFRLDADGDLYFGSVELKTNNMINPFSTDGTDGQLLQTDGYKNLSWVSESLPTSQPFNKFIFQETKQSENQNGSTITIYNNIISGFTVGKTITIDVNYTFYADSVTNIAISCIINSSESPIIIYDSIGAPYTHSWRGFTFSYVNTLEAQSIEILISQAIPIGVAFSTDTNDYVSILVTEKQ